MPEAFSKKLRGAPFRSTKYKNSLMEHTVAEILRKRNISFERGTVAAQQVIHSIRLLATGPERQIAAIARPTISREMVIAITIEIATAHKRIYGDTRALHADSLDRISSGLATILRSEGYPVVWLSDQRINWPNMLELYKDSPTSP